MSTKTSSKTITKIEKARHPQTKRSAAAKRQEQAHNLAVQVENSTEILLSADVQTVTEDNKGTIAAATINASASGNTLRDGILWGRTVLTAYAMRSGTPLELQRVNPDTGRQEPLPKADVSRLKVIAMFALLLGWSTKPGKDVWRGATVASRSFGAKRLTPIGEAVEAGTITRADVAAALRKADPVAALDALTTPESADQDTDGTEDQPGTDDTAEDQDGPDTDTVETSRADGLEGAAADLAADLQRWTVALTGSRRRKASVQITEDERRTLHRYAVALTNAIGEPTPEPEPET